MSEKKDWDERSLCVALKRAWALLLPLGEASHSSLRGQLPPTYPPTLSYSQEVRPLSPSLPFTWDCQCRRNISKTHSFLRWQLPSPFSYLRKSPFSILADDQSKQGGQEQLSPMMTKIWNPFWDLFIHPTWDYQSKKGRQERCLPVLTKRATPLSKTLPTSCLI